MAEAIFTYEGQIIKIQCNKNQKMKDICKSLSTKINEDINSLIFLGQGTQINLEKIFNEITKENKLSILVYKTDIEICPKCGRIINNKMIDDIISMNNNTNYSLIEIKRQIEQVIKDVINKADINFINHQLNNINLIVNNISENIRKINNELNQIKFNGDKTFKQNNSQKDIKNNNNEKEESPKNEITCIYNKQDDEINLLHDYNLDKSDWTGEYKKKYIEGKNNINEKNIDIYINGKKIPFNYKYKSNENGDIKAKFIFNKLLTSTCCMFYLCASLKSIDLSSFNSTNINDMNKMFSRCSSLSLINLSSFNTNNVKDMFSLFHGCSSLKSIDLSSFNTTNVNNMRSMFNGCSSLEWINLSSFNTINVNEMRSMFRFCSSLKQINLSSFITTNVKDMKFMFNGCLSLKSLDLSSFNTTNVNEMRNMFCGCSSLESIDLSSFNTINVKYISLMFRECPSLRKRNIKFNNSDKQLVNEINKYIKY